MTWKSDAKYILQSLYGGYCIMCKELNINPVPFHQFNEEEYNRIKLLRNKKYCKF